LLAARPKALALDGSGNTHVAGAVTLEEESSRQVMVTIRYSPDGTEMWARQYPPDDSGQASPTAMAVDAGGNVYVTGVLSDATGDSFITIRYGQLFVRGDIDGSGEVDLNDGVYWLEWAFRGTTPPPCLEAADVDEDGLLTVSDPILVFRRLFQGGREIPPPTSCGFDSHLDPFGCESFPACQ
jgi:hypothetical protein